MRILKAILGLSVMAAACGCESMARDFEERACNYEGAFQQGLNDAKADKKMNSEALAYQCPANTKSDVRKGYREGYSSIKRIKVN
jgi:hypothetical protein